MSITMDRPIDNAIALRERLVTPLDRSLTGHGFSVFSDSIFQFQTDDEPSTYVLVATQHDRGSFVPAVVERHAGFLEELLSWNQESMFISDLQDEDHLMVLPPLASQRIDFEIRAISYGLPSPFGLED